MCSSAVGCSESIDVEEIEAAVEQVQEQQTQPESAGEQVAAVEVEEDAEQQQDCGGFFERARNIRAQVAVLSR